MTLLGHDTAQRSRRKLTPHQLGQRRRQANERRREREAIQHIDRVLTFRQWCAVNGFSQTTGWRMLRAGKGPKLVQLSERRIGIRESDNRAWQDARVRG